MGGGRAGVQEGENTHTMISGKHDLKWVGDAQHSKAFMFSGVVYRLDLRSCYFFKFMCKIYIDSEE